jgi:hypothetical protein
MHAAAYEKLLDAEMVTEEQQNVKQDAADEPEWQTGVGVVGEADGEGVQNLTTDQEADSSQTGDFGLITTALQLERDRYAFL